MNSIINCKILEQQLTELGFNSTKAICQTASPWAGIPINQPPAPNAHVLTNTCNDNDIFYIFTIGQNSSGSWYIHSIDASFQMDTERNIEEVKVISTKYLIDEQKLPTKSMIDKEVLDQLEIEKVAEQQYINKDSLQVRKRRI